MMEDEVVRRRKWLTPGEFLDLLGATNLVPGPNSTEMAIHVGHRRAGFPGLVVAGVAFIVPATVIVTVIAWAYVRFGELPAFEGILRGVKPVVLAVVVQALIGFTRIAVKNATLGAIAIGAGIAAFAGANELAILGAAGVIAIAARTLRRPGAGIAGALLSAPGTCTAAVAALGVAAVPFTVSRMFVIFLKVGSVLYGSGYVLLAFLRADLVERLGWLTEAQLLDAVAVGQVTPGPVFTTATFIGYVLGNGLGALAATVGIFLPAFFFVALSGPLIPRLRGSRRAGAFLDGVNAASLALMAVVTFQLGRAAIVDVPTALLAVASGLLLLRFRVNSSWLVLAGAILGWVAGSW